ncbi:MAG: ATP-binding protein [Candidatus Omnitrophota bacterium]
MTKEIERLRTRCRKLERQIKKAEGVVRNIAKGLIVVNDSGEILFLNPAAEKILGGKAKQLVGKSIRHIRGAHGVTLVDENGDEECCPAGSGHDPKAGELLKDSSAVIESNSGEIRGMVSVMMGSTQVRQADEDKTEFVANVSHEFRTPLICIQKALMAVREDTQHLTEAQQGNFEVALRNAKRLEKMVNDLLDVSNIASGRMTLRPEIFSVQSMVRGVCNTFSAWARDKHIELIEALPSETLAVEADQERLAQALAHLISNAIKWTESGGRVSIEVRMNDEKTAREPGHAGRVEIGVRDTGPGLSEDDRKKLSGKFSRTSASAAVGEKSPGLGLTLAKEIVELHHGVMVVESQLGKGSYFCFLVPLRPPGTAALPPSAKI